jgi:hypothetical protein
VFFIVRETANRTIQEVNEVHQKMAPCFEEGKLRRKAGNEAPPRSAIVNCWSPTRRNLQNHQGFSPNGTRLELRVRKSLRPYHANGELVQFA